MPKIEVTSEVAGNVWKIETGVGDLLEAEDAILILESMKMEIPVATKTSLFESVKRFFIYCDCFQTARNFFDQFLNPVWITAESEIYSIFIYIDSIF